MSGFHSRGEGASTKSQNVGVGGRNTYINSVNATDILGVYNYVRVLMSVDFVC